MSRSEGAYHHGSLGPALEDAAFELVREHGHNALSLREVARAAGVSHNAPYHHFGDKTALLKRLSERSMAELLAGLEVAETSAVGKDPRAAALAVGVAYVDYAVDHPERFLLIYDPAICVPGSPSEAMAPLITAVETILTNTVARLLPADQSAALIPLTTAMWGAVHGLAELVVAGHITPADIQPALTALLNVPGPAPSAS